MGEAVLAHVATERGLDIDVASAGTANYHVGEEPDERSAHSARNFTSIFTIPQNNRCMPKGPLHPLVSFSNVLSILS